MDGNQNSVVAEEAGEQVEPMDATPSPQPPPALQSEEDQEAVSMVTEAGAPEEGGTQDNDDDDDVVLVGEEAPQPSAAAPQDTVGADGVGAAAAVAGVDTPAAPAPSASPSPPASSSAPKPQTPAEPIVIDDEEDPDKEASPASPPPPGGSSASHSPGALSSTEPDSEIRIASVTTLGSCAQKEGFSTSAAEALPQDDEEQADMNLMITSVTSLQGGGAADPAVSLRPPSSSRPGVGVAKNQTKRSDVFVQGGDGPAEVNGLQISNAFSLNPDCSPGCPTASFNPGRGSAPGGQLAQNGDMGSHNRAGDG